MGSAWSGSKPRWCPGCPCQPRDRHSGARRPATPQFHGPAWPGPYWDGARLSCTRAPQQPGQRGADGSRRQLWQPSAWDRQACPQLVPLASPRVSRLRCLSPCSTQSREPLGGQPDPLGPAMPHGPGGPPRLVESPPQCGVPVLTAPWGLSTASWHSMGPDAPSWHWGSAGPSGVTQQGQCQPTAPPPHPPK